MIKQLRIKFVICTVAMFALCFAILIASSTAISRITYYQDMYQELLWLGETDPLRHIDSDYSDKLNFDMLYYGYNPIYCLVTDANNNVISIYGIGNTADAKLPDAIIEKICNSTHDDWHIGSFVFSQQHNSDDTTQYIITDCSSATESILVTNNIYVSLIALIVITIISILLSGFIIKPAQMAREREKQLTADINHELKTPIASILINLEAMKATGGSSVYLDNALTETNKLKSLVNQLLTLLRAESSEYSIHKSDFNISDSVEKLSLIFESIAIPKEISVTSSIKDDVTYAGDREGIERALSVILDNAIKYTPNGGTVSISLEETRRSIIITISDNGIGIAPDDLPHIFDRFYISEESRTGDSFGLGLPIAKAIINKHGGSISVSSREGRGTQFRVVL